MHINFKGITSGYVPDTRMIMIFTGKVTKLKIRDEDRLDGQKYVTTTHINMELNPLLLL